MMPRSIVLAALLCVVLTIVSAHSSVAGARCQVKNPTYVLPISALPGSQIQTSTTVVGSCFSDGEDYYSVRVDLVDNPTGSTVSTSSMPIGYNATNFNVTVQNIATAPSNNGTWYVNVNVYVIRAGGTGGSYLLDYKNSTTVTIQIGGSAPITEMPLMLGFTVVAAIFSVSALVRRRSRRDH